jgi:hypothetical protein
MSMILTFIDSEPTINGAIHHFDEKPERFEGREVQKSWLREEIKEMKS